MQRPQPYCGENSEPDRYSMERLTSYPELENTQGHKRKLDNGHPTAASLIGRLGQALSDYPSDYPPLQCRCRSRARASLRNRHQGPSIMGFEDEAEQSLQRPCRQTNSRPKLPYDLTSSIVPRGTPFHLRGVQFPPYCIWSGLAVMPLRLPWSSGTRCRQPICGA